MSITTTFSATFVFFQDTRIGRVSDCEHPECQSETVAGGLISDHFAGPSPRHSAPLLRQATSQEDKDRLLAPSFSSLRLRIRRGSTQGSPSILGGSNTTLGSGKPHTS